MYHIIFLLILMIISYIQKENVQLAEFQNLLGPSTAAYVIDVLRGLTTTVDG